jgi:hypothetical protein
MEPALIAALAAVLGVIAGRYWDTRNEARRWQRDQRVRIYEQFAASYFQLREAIRALALLPTTAPEAEQAAGSALDRGAEFNRTIIAVWLHGSKSVIASAHEVERAINDLYVTARGNHLTWEEWVVARQAGQRAIHGFTQSVRGELGLSSVSITMFVVPNEVIVAEQAAPDQRPSMR